MEQGRGKDKAERGRAHTKDCSRSKMKVDLQDEEEDDDE